MVMDCRDTAKSPTLEAGAGLLRCRGECQMTRLSKLPVQDWDGDLRALTQADSATPLEQGMTRVLAHSPEVAKAVVRFGGALFQSTRLPRRLTELLRLRIA